MTQQTATLSNGLPHRLKNITNQQLGQSANMQTAAEVTHSLAKNDADAKLQ